MTLKRGRWKCYVCGVRFEQFRDLLEHRVDCVKAMSPVSVQRSWG